MKLFSFAFLAILATSCTISFQNISTHGTATDLVDEEQTSSPNVSPQVTVPVSALPGGIK